MIARGTTVDGYRIERVLGRGGMGVVYEATQLSLDRQVALKVLRPGLTEDATFVDRLEREGRLQASLEHPHVLDVYEVADSEHGLFFSMRLVRGSTLAELVRDGGLDAARAMRLLGHVGDALDAAHAIGLVHRDVKPQNVLVDDDDTAYLADFGLTRAGDATAATASRPILGTVAYVAPEIIRGEIPGPASDRYSFAATLFQCLTGDVVFPRGSDAAVLYAHASEPPPRASERRADLPVQIDRVFAEALAKHPGERPQSARSIVDAVADAIGPEPLASLGPPPLTPEPTPAAATLASGATLQRPTAAPRRRGLAVLAAACLASAALAAGAIALLDGGGEGEAELAVPAPPDSAQPLGSELGAPERSLDCRGRAASPQSPSCSVVQTELSGATLVAPADGAIVGWAVRGARGELALDIIRPAGPDTTRVGRSQFESAGNAGPHRFATSLAIERGDVVGLELGPGASIGVRAADGAATQRWFEPAGGAYGAPDREPGTGFDHEVLVRADFVPGAGVRTPQQLTGAQAVKAPPGHVRDRVTVEISKPPATVVVKLVELRNRVALDLVRGGRRLARMFMPGLIPRGRPIAMQQYVYEGSAFSEVGVWWVNPNSGRMTFRFVNVSSRQFDFSG